MLILPFVSAMQRSRSFHLRPELQRLEPRALLTTFTLTSPTQGGLLPEGVSPVGGVVIDLIGTNGRRVVSQIRASDLFVGNFSRGEPAEFRGNPGTIGVRSGFSPAVVDALGSSLAELSVRLTVDDGDTGPGDFDREDNTLLLNGIPVGRFDQVTTVETNSLGTVILSKNLEGGFRNDRVDTGFFHVTDPEVLRLVLDTIRDTGQVAVQLLDDDPIDNYFDFTVGIDAGLIDVDLPPEPQNQAPRITSIEFEEPIVEGQPVRVIVVASDPDANDALSFAFSLEGDGRIEPSDEPGQAWLTVPQEGDVRLAVRVEDELGAFDEADRSLVVRNRAPSVTLPATQDTIEGRETILAVGAFDDPGAEDRWAVEVDWGDGSAIEAFEVDQPGLLPNRSHRYLQDGDYTITVRLHDGTDQAAASALVRVRNAPPELRQVRVPGTVTLGDALTITAEIADPGSLDPLAVAIDWGIGEPSRLVLPPGSTSVDATYHYDRIGSFFVTVSVVDDRDAAAVLAVPVTVEPPKPPSLPTFRFDPEPVAAPPSAAQQLAEALLPARSVEPTVETLLGSPSDPGAPAPAIPPPEAAPIAILIGQDAPDPAPRSFSPAVGEAPVPIASAEEPSPAPPPAAAAPDSSEVAAAEAQADAELGSEDIVSAPGSPSTVDAVADSDAPTAPSSVVLASAEGADAAAADAASSTGAAEDSDADSGSKAMRATVLIVAALTVRRGGTRIRKSLRSASVRSARF
ncbi:PKD domain-containing protein [Tautonia marina]|uniref:PKD domain-containing protein n=1 Tax=Tautonia marina TaxID=2653855 RepID=UPI001260BB0F|nr:PKD domain-containing protein [Tautonia marina]